MDANIGVEWAGGDGEGVPLLPGHGGDVDEEPLARLVLHARLGDLQLDGVVGVADHLHDLRLAPRADFSDDALDEIDAAREELPPPPFVTDAVRPEDVPRKGRVVDDAVAHEAVGRVRVHAQQEGDEEVVRVPEGLERLLPDLGVRRCVHQQHAQQHDVARDAAGLRVVDVQRGFRADLSALDVEEAGAKNVRRSS